MQTLTIHLLFNLESSVFVETLAGALLLPSEISMVNFNVRHRNVQPVISDGMGAITNKTPV